MKLYHLPYSHFSSKVRIVLLEKQIDVVLQNVNELPPFDNYHKLNPSGLVPFLLDGNVALGESEVIVEYLDDAYPNLSVLPESPEMRARSRWLSRIHDLYVAPELSILFEISNHSARYQQTTDEHVAILLARLAEIEQHIEPHPYCFGEKFGVADATYGLSLWYAYWLLNKLDVRIDEQRFPAIARWFSAISERESFQGVLRDCQQALGLSTSQEGIQRAA